MVVGYHHFRKPPSMSKFFMASKFERFHDVSRKKNLCGGDRLIDLGLKAFLPPGWWKGSKSTRIWYHFFTVPGMTWTICHKKTGKKDTEKGIDLQTKPLHFQHKTSLWFQIFFLCSPRSLGNPILFAILLFDWYFSDGLVQPPTKKKDPTTPFLATEGQQWSNALWHWRSVHRRLSSQVGENLPPDLPDSATVHHLDPEFECFTGAMKTTNGCLLFRLHYRGLTTTQLYRDYNTPL